MMRPSILVRILLPLVVLVTSATARADREIGLGLEYDPRMPIGSLRGIVPTAGIMGVQGKWEYYAVPDRLALGFGVQYHYFQQGNETRTVDFQNGAATAQFTRYAYFFSLLPSARWFPWGSNLRTVRPFAEIGAGITSATGAVLASALSRRSKEGGFFVQPALGMLWSLYSHEASSSWAAGAAEATPWIKTRRRESMFAVSASVAWAYTTADVLTANNVNYVGIQLGVYSKL